MIIFFNTIFLKSTNLCNPMMSFLEKQTKQNTTKPHTANSLNVETLEAFLSKSGTQKPTLTTFLHLCQRFSPSNSLLFSFHRGQTCIPRQSDLHRQTFTKVKAVYNQSCLPNWYIFYRHYNPNQIFDLHHQSRRLQNMSLNGWFIDTFCLKV